MRKIETGKNKGKTLTECTDSYIIWASQHEKNFSESNRWVSRDAKLLIEKAKEPKMPTTIEISIYPFGSAKEQIWIGAMIEGEFSKSHMLYKDTELSKKKILNGKFGKPSTSEDWTIIVPDGYEYIIAKRRSVGQSTTKIDTEDCVLYPVS